MTKQEAPPDTRYVYIVTRRDLPASHQTVQVAHAAIAATFTFGEPGRTHPHLVVCAVDDEAALESLFEMLKEKGVRCCAYHEPDMDEAITAVATAPLKGQERQPLRRLSLL